MRLYKSKKNVKGGASSHTPVHISQRHLYKNQNHLHTVSHARQIGDLTRKTIILRNTASIEYYHNIVINSKCSNELPVDIADPNKKETDADILHVKNTVYDKPFKKITKKINQKLQMDEIQQSEKAKFISNARSIKSGSTHMTNKDNRTKVAELLKRVNTVSEMILSNKKKEAYQKHKTDMIAFLITNKIYKLLIGNIRNIHNILIEYYTVKYTETIDKESETNDNEWGVLLDQLNEKELMCENRETGGTRFKNKKGSNKKGLNKKGPNKKGLNKKRPNKKGLNKKGPNKKGSNKKGQIKKVQIKKV
jgi:hypothetical protein